MLDTFPHLTTKEFEQACSDLRQRYCRHGLEQRDWEAVEVVHHPDGTCLRITRALSSFPSNSAGVDAQHGSDEVDGQNESDEDEVVEEVDDEVLHVVPGEQLRALIHYDILLSPIYRMPILYIYVSDPLHRCPPTMNTLHERLIPPHFRAQTDSGGVLGGVSVNMHPITDTPVFFIHPCQTAEVMQASVGRRDVTPEEYLVIWIGAMGKCVGLNVPLALMQQEMQQDTDTSPPPLSR